MTLFRGSHRQTVGGFTVAKPSDQLSLARPYDGVERFSILAVDVAKACSSHFQRQVMPSRDVRKQTLPCFVTRG